MTYLLYIDTIQVKDLDTVNAYGDKTMGDAYEIVCSIQDTVKQAKDSNGNLIITDVQIHSTVDVPKGSRMVYDGREREILVKKTVHNHLMGGVDHYEYGL